jgi:CMP-N-acetylneuraminic acid synthetase
MSEKQIVYGVIPARGGSTGVSKKNLRPLGGVPLIAHIIKSALDADQLDKVFVSTEDHEIADVAERLGVAVIRHDPALSGNTSPSFFVIQNAVKHFDSMGEEPDIVVTLHATSPLCPSEYIDKAVAALVANTEADSAISVVRAQVHPYKVLKVNAAGFLEYFDSNTTEGGYPQRRQTFEDVYVRNAAIYAVRRNVIKEGSMWGPRAIPIIMPKEVSVNINEEIDFVLAEALLERNL